LVPRVATGGDKETSAGLQDLPTSVRAFQLELRPGQLTKRPAKNFDLRLPCVARHNMAAWSSRITPLPPITPPRRPFREHSKTGRDHGGGNEKKKKVGERDPRFKTLNCEKDQSFAGRGPRTYRNDVDGGFPKKK